MKYSYQCTFDFASNVNIQNCLKDLNTFICGEGCVEVMPFFRSNEYAIDMDRVEKIIARSERRHPYKSMDSMFIVQNNSNVESIVLVEFRFNYENMKNIKRDELLDKKYYSAQNIINWGYTNINDNSYYVFKTNLVEQARRRFRNINPHLPNEFLAVSIHDIKTTFFDEPIT